MNNTKHFFQSTGLIDTLGDFLDLIGNASYQKATGVLIDAIHLPGRFFDLKSGLAGEYLQKLSNYRMKAAIVLEDSHLDHPRFREMVREANKSGNIAYFKDPVKAAEWLKQ